MFDVFFFSFSAFKGGKEEKKGEASFLVGFFSLSLSFRVMVSEKKKLRV